MRPITCLSAAALLSLLVACTEYTPKPRGYFRIEPPAPVYQPFEKEGWPFSFQLSDQAIVRHADSLHFQLTAGYPDLRASIYCNYFATQPENIAGLFEESRRLVARQAAQADGIEEKEYTNDDEQVYGYLYLIRGNTAAPIQFALTDRKCRFLRGALYFDCHINADSLQPVNTYLQHDITTLIETFKWKR